MASTTTDRIDGLTTSVAVKAPVKAVAVSNITLSGEQTVNGVAVVTGDRVLVTAQTSSVDNGIYNVSSSAWTRSADFDGNRDVVKGTLVVSNTGTTIYYRVTSADPIVIGTSAINFEVVSGAVSQSSIGQTLYPRTDQEIAAAVVPSDYAIEPYNVLRYGADPSGTDDSTAAVQAALNATTGRVYFPSGTYSCGNITLPNKLLQLVGDGQLRSIIKARAGISNTTYLLGSAAYVNNSTSGNLPLVMDGLSVNGSGLVSYPLALYGFFSELRNCEFTEPKASGAALFITSDGISGAACSSTLVENKVINCRLNGAATGDAFKMADTGAKCTDMMFVNNLVFSGASTFYSMAGTLVQGNHFYGGVPVTFNRLSVGTVIDSNYFEDPVTFDDFISNVVSASDNTFLGRVTVSFGNSGKTLLLDGNKWQSTADLYHNYFSAEKHVVVIGGGFETATPVVFHNGSSTGVVTFKGVMVYGSDALMEGSRTSATGLIYKVKWGTDAPTTGTWAVGDQVINTGPTAGGTHKWVCTTAGTPGTWNAVAIAA